MLPDLTISYPTLSHTVSSYIISYLVLTCLALTCLISSYLILRHRISRTVKIFLHSSRDLMPVEAKPPCKSSNFRSVSCFVTKILMIDNVNDRNHYIVGIIYDTVNKGFEPSWNGELQFTHVFLIFIFSMIMLWDIFFTQCINLLLCILDPYCQQSQWQA